MQEIEKARASKHTDAILLLQENKPKVAEKVQVIAKSVESKDATEKEQIEIQSLKKVIALVSELVFQSCIDVLVNDKKDE